MTKIRKNPRRARNLSRNQKIGIALVSVAAVGGATALVIAMRRKKVPEVTDGDTGGEGTGAPVNPLNRARRRLCINPNALTYDQRILLRDQVFIPLVAALPTPGATDAVAIVVEQALRDLCPGIRRTQVVDMVNQIAQQAWETYVGFSG